jgi:hypothetical protein
VIIASEEELRAINGALKSTAQDRMAGRRLKPSMNKKPTALFTAKRQLLRTFMKFKAFNITTAES